MKILLTGNKGFIGKNLERRLRLSHQLITYDWKDAPGFENLPLSSDLDWVIHTGAISSTTETDTKKITEQNIQFTTDLFDYCVANNINFQYSSSASVYGTNAAEFSESSPCAPANLYAESKLITEQYMTDLSPDNIKWQIFRYFNVFGDDEDHKGNQASPYFKFKKQAREQGVIELFEHSEQYLRDFVPVELITDIHVKMLRSTESGIWNLGTGIATSFQTVAESIANAYGAAIRYIPMPLNLKDHYQKYTCADITKINNTLNSIDQSEN